MAAQPQPRLTPEQYLELDRASEFRNEFYDGRMWPLHEPMEAMAGGSANHSRIKINLYSELRAALKKSPCQVFDSDLRISVSADGLYTYPDASVICGEPKYGDDRKDTLLNPILLIEVLSPSTEALDRGFKARQYRSIESLREYLLVSQTEPRVEIYRRRANEWLLTDILGMDAVFELESAGCSLALAEIYDKVEFEAA